MADLQETLNPVNNAGSNPPENPFGGNPGEVQTNPFAEQSGVLSQPQGNIAEQPVSAPAPDLSEAQLAAPTNGQLTNSTEVTTQPTEDSANSQAMINAAKKDKLAQLLKAEQEKGKKAGFTKGLLSGIAITACILAVSVIFAKDQIVDILSDGNNTNPTNLEASIVDLASEDNTDEENLEDEEIDTSASSSDETSDEVATDETSDEVAADETSDEVAADETSDEVVTDETSDEVVTDETSDEVVTDETSDEVATDETSDEVATDETSNEVATDETSDEVATDETSDEVATDETISENGYIAVHVNSPEKANWVISPSCNGIFCENKYADGEISLCSEFKLNDKLDDNAQRIGSSGVCRYKDISELVYIKPEE